MDCPNCGAKNSDGVRYCGNCATPLEPVAGKPVTSRTSDRTKIVAAAEVVRAAVILAGVVGAYHLIPPRTIAVWVDSHL